MNISLNIIILKLVEVATKVFSSVLGEVNWGFSIHSLQNFNTSLVCLADRDHSILLFYYSKFCSLHDLLLPGTGGLYTRVSG